MPLGLPPAYITLLFLFYIYMTMANVFDLLSSYSGMLALGFHGFIGFGGYVTSIATTYWGFSALPSLLLSGALCALLALATSFLISKMRGLYFAVGTLVTAQILFYWFQSWTYVGGGYGMPVVSYVTLHGLYYISLAFALISIFTSYTLIRSRIGLRLKAIADDDLAASTYGIDVFKTKLLCWVISSIFAGFSGGLYFIYSNFISPGAAFSFYWTLSAIAAVAIGGRRTTLGPILGAFIVVLLRQTFLTLLPGLSALVYGILIIIVLFLFPHGIIGYIGTFLGKEKQK
ncbi:MAG: branched-chain amino acid ABC transporter permease [Candidatus Bathyarchaeia archaeon]